MAIGLTTVIGFTLLVLLLAPQARAEGSIGSIESLVKVNDVQRGSLLFKSDHSGLYKNAPILNTDVDIVITAMTARVRVSQSFRNEGQDWVEGIYVFPLPENAAVDHMRMKIGERIIEGQIKERQQAKKIYNEARKAGRKAALVEQERPNIFTNSVANIGPGETVIIDIEYQQTLRYDNQSFSIRFPMVVAPRFIPGSAQPLEETLPVSQGMGWAVNTDQVPDASRITPPVIGEDEALVNPVSIHVDLNAGIALSAIKSLYHPVHIEHGKTGMARIELAEGPVPADCDFVLQWTPTPSQAPRAALFTEQGKQQYSLIMVMPPVLDQAGALHLPREVTFIIDTSGSMGGQSIRQARAALRMAIERLQSVDRFNVIQFNSSMHALFNQPVQASASNLQRALRYVDGLNAGGGTVMEPALRKALSSPENNQFIQQVVFLTDGAVGNESALFRLIEEQLGNKRLFTVGIGSAPNSHFMSRAASFGRGTFTYIGDLSEVGEKMQALFAKLETPAMSHLKLSWPEDIGTVDVYPDRLPDLYSGEPLLISVASQSLAGELIITGQRGSQPWSARLPLHGNTPQQGVGVLWARSRIASLMNQLHGGASKEEIRNAVIETALEHHLVSKYTSLVAVDITPSRSEESMLKKTAVPTNLPHGWDRNKVFGAMPKTATSAQLHLLIGFIVLFMLGLFQLIQTGSLPWGFSGRCSSCRVPNHRMTA